MSVPADTICVHLRYSDWASRRLVEAASTLTEEELTRDFKHSGKSVLGTLAHTFAADRVWLGRIQGNPPACFLDPEKDLKLCVLQEEWPALAGRWAEWGRGLTDDSARELLSYKDMKGNAHQTPVWQVALHVVNHGTHHRGQVSAMLRAMGYTPPPTDLIYFYREFHS
ncbi:MAG TPA: DinB family protein [Bryobacteraceae bacterium]|nr:DinB family protein [Bryobacteraceae bacterium]